MGNVSRKHCKTADIIRTDGPGGISLIISLSRENLYCSEYQGRCSSSESTGKEDRWSSSAASFFVEASRVLKPSSEVPVEAATAHYGRINGSLIKGKSTRCRRGHDFSEGSFFRSFCVFMRVSKDTGWIRFLPSIRFRTWLSEFGRRDSRFFWLLVIIMENNVKVDVSRKFDILS